MITAVATLSTSTLIWSVGQGWDGGTVDGHEVRIRQRGEMGWDEELWTETVGLACLAPVQNIIGPGGRLRTTSAGCSVLGEVDDWE